MSKITIAAATLAGLAISDRLNELALKDEILFEQVGNLASALGAATAALEHVNTALAIVAEAQLQEDEDTVMRGLAAVKGQIEDLVADQDKVQEALLGNLSEEERAMLELMTLLNGLGLGR